MDLNNRNFFITIALSVLILTLWQVFYMNPRIEAQREAARIEAGREQSQDKTAADATAPAAQASQQQGEIPSTPGAEGAAPAGRDQALATTGRVKIDTPSLQGSINLTGARLDDLRLKHYRETVDPASPEIELL